MSLRQLTQSVQVRRAWFASTLLVLTLVGSTEQTVAADEHGGSKDELPLVVERGAGRQRIVIPRDEELVFEVSIDLGALGSASAGDVTLTSQVTPFHPEGLLALDAKDGAGLEQALVTAHAIGEYALYKADQTISTRILPQEWPHFLHRNEQTGTENRKRELMIGTRDGKPSSQHRSDGHCKGCTDRAHFMKPNWVWQDEYHCKKCRRAEHRVWRAPEDLPVPEGTLDMVSAMMAARTLVLDKGSATSFPLIDKETLWMVDLSLGKHAKRKVKAGTFNAVEVQLKTHPPEGAKNRDNDFEGLFGLHGTITIWMEIETGVPIEVRGTVPAGPFELDVAIELAKFRGTPPGFRSLGKK